MLSYWQGLMLPVGLMLLWSPHAGVTPGRSWLCSAYRLSKLVWHSLVPCCSVPKEEGCMVQSVTVVQTELHFMSAKKLFVSIASQSRRLFVSWTLLSCIHLSNKNKCRKWKKKPKPKTCSSFSVVSQCVYPSLPSLCHACVVCMYFCSQYFSLEPWAAFHPDAARPWELGGWMSPPTHPKGFMNWAWATAAPAGDMGLQSEM